MHVLTVEDERGSKEMEWYQIRTAEDGEKKGAAATEGELGGGTKKVVAGLARRAGGRGRSVRGGRRGEERKSGCGFNSLAVVAGVVVGRCGVCGRSRGFRGRWFYTAGGSTGAGAVLGGGYPCGIPFPRRRYSLVLPVRLAPLKSTPCLLINL